MTWGLIGCTKANLTHGNGFGIFIVMNNVLNMVFHMSAMFATQPSSKLDASIKLIIRDQSNWGIFINYLLNHNSNLLLFSLLCWWQASYKDLWNLFQSSKLNAFIKWTWMYKLNNFPLNVWLDMLKTLSSILIIHISQDLLRIIV
jgi:hypothetical protein